MDRVLTYCVESECTVWDFLKRMGFPRGIIRRLKLQEDTVLVNGVGVFLNYCCVPGDSLVIRILEDVGTGHIVPVDLPIRILYEDEDIVLLDKAADMPIHPSQGNFDNTLANGLTFYYEQKGESFVYRCITRLDRDTTGVLLVAKNGLSAALLSQQMLRREIHRTYLAVVEGIPAESTGRIEAPISRVDGSTIEREVNFDAGERAVTNYQVIRSITYEGRDYSLVKLQLETGRTHQIRVHMKYLGYPLIGDFLYNPNYSIMKRQALHSSSLSFVHPISGKMLDFTAPIPADMKWIYECDIL
ncbi:MAG: RluA family pseudouridine synthase [Lachnospiraceae bacterium]|nr:RluA family pseudouridine synthase [Lachnospiraceae bacterium]MDD3615000.1 RluA family pseudouridine synthase [Lachnospiraceae bacterium]